MNIIFWGVVDVDDREKLLVTCDSPGEVFQLLKDGEYHLPTTDVVCFQDKGQGMKVVDSSPAEEWIEMYVG